MGSRGVMTSPALMAMLRTAIQRLYPDIPVRGRDKVAMLDSVREAHGDPAVFALGRELRHLASHPVLQAVIAAKSPRAVLERWMSLERFGHSQNRVQFVSCRGDAIKLRHVALSGDAIEPVNSLFVWGLLTSLLEMAGAADVRIATGRNQTATHLLESSPIPRFALPMNTATFRWRAYTMPRCEPQGAREESMRLQLERIVRHDPIEAWTVERAARALATSRRALQRALENEGSTFSETLQRSRVEVARSHLADHRLTLTNVAFCAGFADHAHFSRTFRRYLDVPPSALRALLLGGNEDSRAPLA